MRLLGSTGVPAVSTLGCPIRAPKKVGNVASLSEPLTAACQVDRAFLRRLRHVPNLLGTNRVNGGKCMRYGARPAQGPSGARAVIQCTGLAPQLRIGHAVERLTRTWRKGIRDEQKSALRIRAAAEELRQIARRMARPDDRVALTSVASSMDAEATVLDSASVSATKLYRSQLERDFDRRSR